jgi:adenosine deaminase
MCFLRDWSAEFAMATLLQSLPYKEWIIGVGLDSDEKNNPPVKFAKVFQRAREEGYFLTMHCDVDQQNSVGHIWQTLNDIGVDRIDHGVNALEDEKLCAEIKRRSLALTVCPISNAYVTDSSKATAIKSMLDRGMRVTVNSDDPAYFPGYITENLIRTQREVDLGKAELLQLARNAFEGSWLPRATKDKHLAKLDAYPG